MLLVGTGLFLERERELARVFELVEAVVAGAPRLVVVEGPAGAGKSAVLNVLAAGAGERGVRVLRATGLELEREYPFGVVRQLFEPALYELDEGARGEVFAGAAALAERVLSGGDSGSGARVDAQGFALLHSFYWALVGLSDLGPVALVVDDVQWADSLSLRFLAFALKRFDGLPVLVALGCRDVAVAERSEALAAVLGSSGSVIRPEPLSPAAIGLLLAGVVGREFGEELVAEAERLTEGNPLYVRELADWLSAADEGAGDPVEVIRGAAPAAVGRRVQSTLARLDPAARALAGAAAILGNEVPLARAALLAGVAPAEASACADVLARAGILSVGEPLRFRHPLVLEAALESIEPRSRAREHGRAGKLLMSAGEPPERVAVHLLESDPAGDPEVATALRVAAKRAAAKGALELAIGALRRALREPPPPAELLPVLSSLGGLEMLVGDAAAVGHLEQAFANPGSLDEAGDAVVAYLWLLILRGRLAEAQSLIDRVLAAISDRERRLILEAELCQIALLYIPSARARLERATVGLTGETPGERLLLGVHACDAMAVGAMTASQVAPLVKQALADPSAFVWRNAATFHSLTSALVWFDELEAADKAFSDAVADARRRGVAVGMDGPWMWRAIIAWRRGQLLRAEADARTAIEIAVQVGTPEAAPLPAYVVVDVLIERGELAEAERLLEEHNVLTSPPHASWPRDLIGARGRLRLARGQTESGIADFTEALARIDAVGETRPDQRTRWAIWLVPVLMQAGRAEEAGVIADTALVAARGLGVPRYIARGLHASALAHADGPDIDQLQEAVSIYERIDAPLELAHALANLGTALRHRRQSADARDPLRRALDLAHACGALALAERAEHGLRAAGARPRRDRITGRDALTASEQRIAELAIEGMSNRQIAETLFITRKTVESHLEHVFRKLDVHARGQLRQALAAQDQLVPVT
jgi:DNA-binding CsgD family transcriptional regulator